MNLGVGWVEERNPTPEEIGIVGFHFVTPNLLSLGRVFKPLKPSPLSLGLHEQSPRLGGLKP